MAEALGNWCAFPGVCRLGRFAAEYSVTPGLGQGLLLAVVTPLMHREIHNGGAPQRDLYLLELLLRIT